MKYPRARRGVTLRAVSRGVSRLHGGDPCDPIRAKIVRLSDELERDKRRLARLRPYGPEPRGLLTGFWLGAIVTVVVGAWLFTVLGGFMPSTSWGDL